MVLTQDKATYFWLRYLEGADPETRTLRKWNAAYPDDQVTLLDITGFIAEMLRLKKEEGLTDYYAMQRLIDSSELQVVDGGEVKAEKVKPPPVLSVSSGRKRGA